MSNGRLDIYWPDGPIESYHLDQSTVAIGRSTGNDIVLDTTAVSRYHVTITFQNQQAVLRDLESVNGTYVDGVRLEANEPFVLRGGEEIQIGDIRLILHPASDMLSAVADTTQRITFSQPTYRIELEGPEMAVSPGAHVQAVLTIDNLSDEADHYFVEVDGLPKGWVRLDKAELEIESGGQSQVLLSFKPLRRSESQPGDHAFVVHVRSKSNPAYTIDAPTVLHVLPYSGFGMALGSSRIERGSNFKLYVHNQGNAPLTLGLQGTDRAHRLTFQLPKNQLVLGPGERQTLTGGVKLRRPKLFGPTRDYEFDIVARSHDAAGFAASVPGSYIESGMLPAWMPLVALSVVMILVLIVAGIVLLALNGEDETPESVVQPVIVSFAVTNPVITLGETTQAAWSVTDADSLELSRDEQPPANVQLEEAAYPLTFDQTGLYNLTLTARNGEALVTQTAIVEVRPSVNLTLGSTELVRFVQQEVQLSWETNGASPLDNGYNVWVEGPDSPLLPPPLSLAGEESVVVVPGSEQAEWLVTLYAEGEDGVVASITQKLPIANPVCELRAERTFVREGPGEAYEAIAPLESSAQGNPSLVPMARDTSGAWLQVSIGVSTNARIGWVLLDDFGCTNFDPKQLMPATDVPPLPTPTLPATSEEGARLTPTPSATVLPEATPLATRVFFQSPN
jgi:hypothetical protein